MPLPAHAAAKERAKPLRAFVIIHNTTIYPKKKEKHLHAKPQNMAE
jgi:hypothetical protein